MDPIEKRELKRKARMRLAAQRRRAGLLRGRVVALSLICFVVLWGVVFGQMVTGNDPVLGGKEKAVAARVAVRPSQEIQTTDPRELEPERETDSKEQARSTEVETESEETERAEIAEAELAEAEVAEAEVAEIEQAEAEPLVTSQS
jgi:hypothetical protein